MAPLMIDAPLVERLIREQLPQWSHLQVRPVDVDGWDNRSFRLGEGMVVRLPSAVGYVPQVGKEARWLPTLAAALPWELPEVLALGEPGAGYPFPWSVRRWIDGSTPTLDAPPSAALTADLARFLRDLRAVAPEGPGPGPHGAGRGAPLTQWDAQVSRALAASAHRVDVAGARDLWADARDAPGPARPSWFHGDVAPGNVLLRDGALAAVIDFGQAGVGDPACDLALAWQWCDGAGRASLRAALGDDAEWRRGAGWALWKALITLDEPAREGAAIRTLAALGVDAR
ncbi:aminoglycoside phosphotransferase family protein [Agrococcus sp. SL85]|uniref:aminoglycoside phosphotransferase family protein n=1 Tax=Agrococcus sp. SL85 TaxID=2995141 RepID=UPI00226D22CE|nr:aminoglycoside phosphotransferase family protein [Agrococcus sp. SL85]WAC65522.1 aminoglycoside phosphotransferase family protein [Agrococcus sp. SL85]